MMKSVQRSYLVCINYFSMPISISCPVSGKVNDEDVYSFGISLKGMCVSFVNLE